MTSGSSSVGEAARGADVEAKKPRSLGLEGCTSVPLRDRDGDKSLRRRLCRSPPRENNPLLLEGTLSTSLMMALGV